MNNLIGTPVLYNLPNRPDARGTITKANPVLCWVTFPVPYGRGEVYRFEQDASGDWRLPGKNGTGQALRLLQK